MKLVRGMTENFNEKCDLIVSNLGGALNPRIRRVPLILVGPASYRAAFCMRAGVLKEDLHEVLRWGDKKEMRVWVANTAKFDLPAALADTPSPTDLFKDIPVELAEALLVEYPGAKDIVADPSMGSGTVGAAARELFLGFIGVEPSVARFTKAKERLGA